MTQKLIYFFPHNPLPPRSGAHKRCLEILAGLRKLDLEVIFVSSTLSSETVWDADSISQLEQDFVSRVCIYKPKFLDWKLLGLTSRFYGLTKIKVALDSNLRTPIRMRWWFDEILEEISPDIIIMSYCFWDGLLNRKQLQSTITVVDTIDLFTVNNQMNEALRACLPSVPIQLDEVNEGILQEDFFNKASWLGLR